MSTETESNSFTVSSPGGALADSHLAAIVQSSFDGIVSKDLDGIVRSWNPAAKRIFGWSAEEMVGESIRRLIPEDLQSEEDEILKRVRAGEQVPRFKTQRLSKAGKLVPVAITVSPVLDEAGDVIGASKIVSDLRPQIDSERDAAETEERFRALADNIPQLAWMADRDGSIFWYNQRWYDFTGTTFDEMEGWGWQKVHHPDHIDAVRERFKAAIDVQEAWEDTFPLRGANGDYRWFLSRALPVRDEKGDVKLYFGTNTDVTQQREHEEQIEVLMREVNHRAKNMLAVLQSIVHRTAKDVDPAFVTSLERRIAALASNQDLLIKRGWRGASVRDVLDFQLDFISEVYGDRIEYDGPRTALILRPVAAEALGLVIHELATNAIKYGSLSQGGGSVCIRWKVLDDEGAPRLLVEWSERDGPPVREPLETGFGTILTQRNPASVMNAKVRASYRTEGFHWCMEAPLESIQDAAAA
ncbi:PAS domain S-box protein [Sphingomicrobium sp. XHP0235]|uniref:PAS domain S-box protein n=1 Tax=Sphingomicrobium aquimarinum TaxID=3133971 RepID=UPI0031FF1146